MSLSNVYSRDESWKDDGDTIGVGVNGDKIRWSEDNIEKGISLGDIGRTGPVETHDGKNTLKNEIIQRLQSNDPLPVAMKKKFVRKIIDSGPEVGGVEKGDLDKAGWALPISLSYGTFFVGVLIYFSVSNTNQTLSAKYLSMTGTDSNQICDVVPQTLTASFEGDYHGAWATKSKSFQANSSIFILKFTGSHIGDDEYASSMSKFRSKMREFGQKATARHVAWSSFTWSTFNLNDDVANLQFYSSVDAGMMVSHQEFSTVVWSSRYGICNDNMTADSGYFMYGSYDAASKSLRMNLPLHPEKVSGYYYFREDANNSLAWPSIPEPCPSQGTMGRFFYFNTNYFMQKVFSLGFDVRSIAITYALNMGILSTADLVQVTAAFSNVADLSGTPGSYWIDTFYSPMEPVFCIDKTSSVYNLTTAQINGPEVCFLALSGRSAAYAPLFYPVIDQFRNADPSTTFSSVQPCRCPDDLTNRQCNQMDFFFTLFTNSMNSDFDSAEMVAYGLKMQGLLLDDPINGDIAIQNYTAPITILSTAASPYGGDWPLDTPIKYLDSDWDSNAYLAGYSNSLTLSEALTEAYDELFPNGTFTAIVFETFYSSKSAIFEGVNPYFVQLGMLSNETYLDVYWGVTAPRQMCTDTFSQPTALDAFVSSPPVPLVQDFFECHATLSGAASAAIGSAAGSAGLYSSIAIAIVGFLVVFYVNLTKSEKVNGATVKKLLPAALKSDARDLKDALEKEALIALLEGLVAEADGRSKYGRSNDLSSLLEKIKRYSADLDEN